MSSPKANRFAGTCHRCGGHVPEMAGILAFDETEKGWVVEHDGECAKAGAPPSGGDPPKRTAQGDGESELRCAYRLDGRRCPLGAVWWPGSARSTEGYCRAHSGTYGWWDDLEPAEFMAQAYRDPAGVTRRIYGGA